MAITHLSKRFLSLSSSILPLILGAERLFPGTPSSHSYSLHFQQSPCGALESTRCSRQHTEFHSTPTDVSVLLCSLFPPPSQPPFLPLLPTHPPLLLSNCLDQFVTWTHHILPFTQLLLQKVNYWIHSVPSAGKFCSIRKVGMDHFCDYILHWPCWREDPFWKNAVSLSHFWQASFLTKAVVGLLEPKDCCEPFLHLQPWRWQRKLGLQSAPPGSQIVIQSSSEKVGPLSGVAGLPGASQGFQFSASLEVHSGQRAWVFFFSVWYLAMLSSNPSSALAELKTV